MANPNPNPKNRFKKGHVGVAGPGRPSGSTNVLTRDIKVLIREAAEEVGLIQRVRKHIRAARDAGGRNWCPFSIPLRLGGHGRSLSVIRQ
jgi:hypothetical protein